MRMRNFWAQMAHFPKGKFFFRKPVNKPCFFHSWLSICQKSKPDINILVKYWQLKNSEILTIKEYWNLIGRGPFLAINWEPDFTQACSFCRILMNHKKFHLTQIPDKTNDVIFLKSPKTFWAIFDHFCLVGIFFKKSGYHTQLCMGP